MTEPNPHQPEPTYTLNPQGSHTSGGHQPGVHQPGGYQAGVHQPGVQHSPDVRAADLPRRRLKLMYTLVAMDLPAIVMMVLGLAVLDSMPLFWAGLALAVFAALYFVVGFVRLQREAGGVSGHITPPGEPT